MLSPLSDTQGGQATIDELKPYPQYKDTFSVWLGSVPTPWEVRSLRMLDEIRADILALEKESEGLLSEIEGGDSHG